MPDDADIHASFRSEPEVVYENEHQRVYTVTVGFGTFVKRYFVTSYGTRAGVVVHSPAGVLLTRQYRHLIDRLSWEIPGGRVDDGEQPDDAARRECQEETGVQPGRLEPLAYFQAGLDTVDNPTYVFAAALAIADLPARLPDIEVSRREWVPLERCLQMIDEGQIVDSLSIVALLAYARKRKT
jgi:8-oxo-dGTP pyrophosphatase MutT (NUDIX family)